MIKIVTIYLIIINLTGLFVMWEDKRRAKKNLWRIPEKVLFGVALLGGAFGTTYGMYRFRHKTKHWYFNYGFPVILAAEAGILIWILIIR